jgi:hypothetical protein
MVGLSRKYIKRVRQQVQDRVEAVLGAGRAARKVDDECAAGDAADTPAKRCECCLLEAAEADLLGNAGNEAVTNCQSDLGGNIALREACAARGEDEVSMLSGVVQGGCELDMVVWDYLGINHLRAVLAQQAYQERAGDVCLCACGAAIARGNHDGGPSRQTKRRLLHLPRIADVRPSAPGCSALRQRNTRGKMRELRSQHRLGLATLPAVFGQRNIPAGLSVTDEVAKDAFDHPH